MLEYNPDLLNKGNLATAAIPILEMLLEKGTNPNITNWIGVTPLHTMAEQGDTERAEIIIKHGADLNPIDGNRQTPLHLATERFQKEVITLLLDKGADFNLKNVWGKIPFDLAQNETIRKLFKKQNEENK